MKRRRPCPMCGAKMKHRVMMDERDGLFWVQYRQPWYRRLYWYLKLRDWPHFWRPAPFRFSWKMGYHSNLPIGSVKIRS